MNDEAILRKGWCPGALRPMPAKDGLLVRIRVTGGRLSAATLRALARAGRDCGNGLFDLTSRANLQMRGVSAETLPRLLDRLRSLGLLDESVSGEAVRNVLISPLAGLERPDIVEIAAALERALVETTSLHMLPAKFGFSIDDGGSLSLAGVPADIRFSRAGQNPDANFTIGLGGREDTTVPVGSCAAHELVATALGLVRAFLDLGSHLPRRPRRMRDLLHAVDPETIAAAAGLRFQPRTEDACPAIEPSPIGSLPLGNGGICLGIGATFGRLDSSMLEAATDAAEAFGSGEIRLTPWRALLIPGVASGTEARAILSLSRYGFITDPADERLAIAACGGASACKCGTTDTHADAMSVADLAASIAHSRSLHDKIGIHVSGCAKGCARPSATACVLVARGGLYDLVVDGTARDAPLACHLTTAEAGDLIRHLLHEGLANH